jgi:putative selenium metabolism hydrolase
MNAIQTAVNQIQSDLIEFAQDLVRTKSYSGDERAIIHLIEKKMKHLDYDDVIVDSMGNIVGRIGNGQDVLMFDSHVDTVAANDPSKWTHDPFGGVIEDGMLYGRGSVDMKSSVAASIYAVAMAKTLGLDSGKSIYVSGTVMEEDCDGENLKHLFKALDIKPDYVVICEPSANRIALGHKGKAQISIKTHGVSAHGSAPEKGVNAIYEMAEIIQRAEKLNLELMKKEGARGTLVISSISSISASLNAVPLECDVYLDRRMVPGETKDSIRQEIEHLIKGKNATWAVGTLHRKSWTGMDITYEPFHLAWEIDLNHELSKACIDAYREIFGNDPGKYEFWDFSTNAVTPVSMGIPTIGFGPGESKMAHMRNECCEVNQIVDACRFYAQLIQTI